MITHSQAKTRLLCSELPVVFCFQFCLFRITSEFLYELMFAVILTVVNLEIK